MKWLSVAIIGVGVGCLLVAWTRRNRTLPLSVALTRERLQMLCKGEEH